MAHQRSHLGGGSGHLYGAHSSSDRDERDHSNICPDLSGLRDEDEELDVDPRQHQLSSQHPHAQHAQHSQHSQHSQRGQHLTTHHSQHALSHHQQHPSLQQHSSLQHSQHSQAHSQLPQLSHPTHHHHHLPDQPAPLKMPRTGPGPSSMAVSVGGAGPSSATGAGPSASGMPPPQPRARGPKQKFTPEDDQLLVDLKENKALTWKQISEYFPGRSSGTLQVRYCTKLKAKGNLWTDETVSTLVRVSIRRFGPLERFWFCAMLIYFRMYCDMSSFPFERDSSGFRGLCRNGQFEGRIADSSLSRSNDYGTQSKTMRRTSGG